jgi:hypothetical protein
LAVEENINSSESLKRSWELTKPSAFRIQGVVILAGLVTLPIVFSFNSFNYLPNLFLLAVDARTSIYWLVYTIAMAISLLGGMFVMPFW